MDIVDYRDNPVKINNIKDEKISSRKIELLKNFIDSYICNCNGVLDNEPYEKNIEYLDNEPYEKIIEYLDGDAFVTSFENALGFDAGDVLEFAKEYYKNYKK